MLIENSFFSDEIQHSHYNLWYMVDNIQYGNFGYLNRLLFAVNTLNLTKIKDLYITVKVFCCIDLV